MKFKAGDLMKGHIDTTSPVYQIFNRPFQCITRNIDVFQVDGRPDQLPGGDKKPQSVIEASFGVEHEHIPNPASQSILDELSGRNQITGTDEEVEAKLNEKTTRGLAISQMAEIYDSNGYLELPHPTDAQVIKGLIDEYVLSVAKHESYHATPPPEEDMLKLKNLSSAMAVVIRRNSEEKARTGSFLDRLVINNRADSNYRPAKRTSSEASDGQSAMARARSASEQNRHHESRPETVAPRHERQEQYGRGEQSQKATSVELGRSSTGNKIKKADAWSFRYNT